MAKRIKPPSADYIKDLAKQLETKFSDRNRRIDEVRRRRYGKELPKIPQRFQKTASAILTPFVSDYITRAAAIMSSGTPVPKRIPVKEGIRAQEQSSLVEEWMEGAYRKMEEANPLWDVKADAACGDGLAIWKIISERYKWGIERAEGETDDDWVAHYKAHKKGHFPFYQEYVDATSFYPVFDEDGLAEVIEITYRETLPLQRKYGKKLGLPLEKDASTTVKFLEYWNRDVFCYQVGETIVKSDQHGWGKPPYYIASASVGSSRDPAYQNIPLSFDLLNLQDNLNSIMTMDYNWLHMNGFPQWVLQPIDSEAMSLDASFTKIDLPADADAFALPPGQKIGPLSPPPVSGEFASMRDFLLSMIEKKTLAPILSGIMPGADMSGVTANTAIAIAKSILGPLTESFKRAYDQMGADILRYIDTQMNGEAVPVWAISRKGKGQWKEIDANDIDGYYELRHNLTPLIPAEAYQKGIYFADAQSRGGVSMRFYREEGLGLHDPESMDDEVFVEDAVKWPQFMNLVWQETMNKLGLSEQPYASQGTESVPPEGSGGLGQPQMQGIQQPMPGYM